MGSVHINVPVKQKCSAYHVTRDFVILPDILSSLSFFRTVFAAAHSLLQQRIQPCVCERQWKQGQALGV